IGGSTEPTSFSNVPPRAIPSLSFDLGTPCSRARWPLRVLGLRHREATGRYPKEEGPIMAFRRREPVYDDDTPATTTTRTRSWSPIGSGELIGLVGAAAVIVSLFLSWRDGGVHPSDVPASFLWDRTTSSTDPSLLVFLIPGAALMVLGLWPRIGAGVRLLGAVIVLAVAGLFACPLARSPL